MKTQLQKPSSGKAHFNEEYKAQALELWKSSGRSAAKVAAELEQLVEFCATVAAVRLLSHGVRVPLAPPVIAHHISE
jgi:hypothetical protein